MLGTELKARRRGIGYVQNVDGYKSGSCGVLVGVGEGSLMGVRVESGEVVVRIGGDGG